MDPDASEAANYDHAQDDRECRLSPNGDFGVQRLSHPRRGGKQARIVLRSGNELQAQRQAVAVDAAGIAYDLPRQAGAGTWQLFSTDPNGAKVELDFDPAETL